MSGIYYQQFVLPFLNPKRCLFLLATFLGVVTTSFLTVYLGIHFAETMWRETTLFYLVRHALVGLLLYPIFYYTMAYMPRRYFLASLLVSTLVGAVALWFLPFSLNPMLLSVVIGCFNAAFWQLYQTNLVGLNAGQQMPYLVSLNRIIMRLASVVGTVAAGFAAAWQSVQLVLLVVFALQLVANMVHIIILPKFSAQSDNLNDNSVSTEPFWQLFLANGRLNVGVIINGLTQLLAYMLLPLWLSRMGYAPHLVGGMAALQAFIGAVLAPWAAKFVGDNNGWDYKAAAFFGVIGWGVMVFNPSAQMLAVATLCWSLHTLFLGTAIEARWYNKKSATQIMVREFVLCLTRMLFVPLLLAAIFFSTPMFAWFGLSFALVAWPVTQWAMVEKTKG